MATGDQEVGKYVLPIMPSIEGIGPEIDRKLGKAFGGVSKQASLAISGGVRDGVKEAEAAVKKSSDAIAKLRDKEAAAADKLATAEARIEEVREKGGSALKRAEGQRNAAYRAQQAALRDIEQQTRSLERAQQSLTEAQEEAARGGARAGQGFLTGLRGSVAGAAEAGSGAASSFAEGFAGSSALLRLGSAGGPVGAALAAAGLIGGGLLVKNVMAGIEREPARDLIQARLRIDDASMAALGKSAATAYVHNFGESVPENLNVGQLAIQGGLVIDANDPALTGVIEKIQGINQLIGGDLTKTVQSVSILMRSGMASSAEEAFNLIARGYEITGDLGGDFLDSIGEYSSGWKNAGLTAQQALALIKQAQDNGVDVTDRSADALREFGRRLSEEGDTIVTVLDNIGLDGEAMFEKFKQGGPAGFEAFDAVFDRIRAIEDPVKQDQVALALLGDQAGDFIDAFEQWDPSSAVNAFGEIDGAAQQALGTLGDNTAGAFEEVKRSVEVSLDNVQDKLAAVFGDDLKEAAQWVEEHTDDIAGFFTTVGEFAIEAVAQIVKFAADSSRALAQFVNVVGDVQGGILTAGATILDLVGQDDAAEQWRRDAESMYGLADGLYDFADAADRNYQRLEDVKDEFGNIGDEAEDATTSTSNLGNAIDGLPRDKTVKLNVVDGNGNPVPLNVPLGSNGVPLPVPGVPNASAPPGYQVVPGSGTPSGTPSFTPAIPPMPGLPGLPGGGGGGVSGGRAQPGSGFLGAGRSTFPASVEQWRPLVRQALAQYGPSYGIANTSAWEDALIQQIKTESGGNPGSVNPSDSNGRGGSQRVAGLLNFLESTYNANNVTGLPYMDPYGQIVAAIVYTAKRWGMNPDGSPRQIGRGQGFEYGGPVFGGIRGKDSVPALLAGDEHVVTADEVSAAGGHDTWFKLRAMAKAGLLLGFDTGGVVPELEQVKKIAQGFGLQVSSGLREGDSGYHGRGLALDLSNGSGNTPQMLAFAQYMAANFGGQLAELIYDSPGWAGNVKDGRNVGPFGEFYTMQQAGNHQNHVHVAVRGNGQTLALGNQQLAGPQVASAFGPGYQAGIGTPGYNELGEPGYYQTDPRSIAQADRRVEDTQQAIIDADQRVADAKKKQADLADDVLASAEDRAKADREVERAERDATRAREDAQFAQEDAAEARRGRFSAAKEARQQSGQNGAGDLSPLGGIFGSFLKETFGFDGSLFPDIANLMPVQMFGNALSAFKGPILGALQGQLGVQQPGWQPGMPVQLASGSSGGGLPLGLVPSPFDFAGVAGPGSAPPGTPASGIGSGPAPGPVDMSRNVSISVAAGPTTEEIGQTVRREVASVDRLNTYAPRGSGG